MSDFRFTCACCGKEIVGIPDIAFQWPHAYEVLSEEDRVARALIGSDLCVIDGRDYFIRAVCMIPVRGGDRQFGWGVWVSLSGENFGRYSGSFDDSDQSKLGPMFGWFSNLLPGYPDTLSLKTSVEPQDNNQRPLVWISDEHADHPLYREQTQGIGLEDLSRLYARELCENRKD